MARMVKGCTNLPRYQEINVQNGKRSAKAAKSVTGSYVGNGLTFDEAVTQ